MRRRQSEWACSLKRRLLRVLRDGVPDAGRYLMRACIDHPDAPLFNDCLVKDARKCWLESLGGQEELNDVPQYQPFWLRAVGKSLRIAGDPDWRVMASARESYSTGVPVGTEKPLPRVPAVYSRKMRWRTLDDTLFQDDMANYRSTEGLEDVIEKQFLEEAVEGLMFRVSESEAKNRYGEKLR
eukprot:2425511-Amphidinium_carterae.1